MWACVRVSLDGASSPRTTRPERSHISIASGVRSSKATPLALMTISSSPGTRAEMLPLVQATSPLRGSSWWSSASSARREATASAMDGLLGADAAQLVHDVVAAPAEVVVQADVARVELVVDVGP